MKICYIAPLFQPWGLGGAEKYIEILVKEFAKENDVLVITTMGPEPRNTLKSNHNYRIIELKNSYPIDLHSFISNQSSLGKIQKVVWYLNDIWSLSVFVQINSILKKEKPEIVHTNGFQGISTSVFSAIKRNNIPHVHTLHNYELFSHWATMYRNGKPITKFNFLDKLYLAFMRKMSSNVTAVISPSKFVMDLAKNYGFFQKSKKFVIPHGIVSTNTIQPKIKSSDKFLYFGRLDESKGIQIAIEAFKKNSSHEVQLHIVGSGPFEKELRKLAKDDKRIIFHGYLEHEKLELLLNQCSYLIVPSIWYEPFGLVTIEALNHGLPVIASKIGAIPEIITPETNGFLFEPGNSFDLSKIIDRTISDHTLIRKMSQNALNSSLNYPLQSVFKSVKEIYGVLSKQSKSF